MKTLSRLVIPALALLGIPSLASAALIAGVDFGDSATFDAGGTFNITPDDLNPTDQVAVSVWSFVNGGSITNDTNTQLNRPGDTPVGKFNGQDGLAQVLVGSAPPANNIHSFSITIGATTSVNLSDVSFSFSMASDQPNTRWLGFRTSLDTTLTYSQVGVLRPNFTAANVDLSAPLYQNLTDQTVTFFWYAGGTGTGDIDIDNILVEGTVTQIPEPSAPVLALLAGLGFLLRRPSRRR